MRVQPLVLVLTLTISSEVQAWAKVGLIHPPIDTEREQFSET